MALAEKLQREDLSPGHAAAALEILLRQLGSTRKVALAQPTRRPHWARSPVTAWQAEQYGR
jgi:hypothetical protein